MSAPRERLHWTDPLPLGPGPSPTPRLYWDEYNLTPAERQRGLKCCCPATERRECVRLRYGAVGSDDKGCRCACHDRREGDRDE